MTEIKDDEAECKNNGGNLIEIDSDRIDACNQIKSVGYTLGFNGKRKEKRTLSVDNVLFAGTKLNIQISSRYRSERKPF